MNGKSISIGNIVWRVLRQPIAEGLTIEQASEFALEYLRLINAPLLFIDIVTEPPIEIIEYKGELPQNLINIRGVQYVGHDGCSDGIAMRYATDIYHVDLKNQSRNEDGIHGCNDFNTYPTEYTYITQNCNIITSVRKGFIKISYKSIATDENNFPLIPDNESYKMGLEYYILHRFLEPLWVMGKIQDKVFSYIEQKRHWYLAQATSSSIISSPDHLQSVMNGLNRLIINTTAFESGYKNAGEQERIYKYH